MQHTNTAISSNNSSSCWEFINAAARSPLQSAPHTLSVIPSETFNCNSAVSRFDKSHAWLAGSKESIPKVAQSRTNVEHFINIRVEFSHDDSDPGEGVGDGLDPRFWGDHTDETDVLFRYIVVLGRRMECVRYSLEDGVGCVETWEVLRRRIGYVLERMRWEWDVC